MYPLEIEYRASTVNDQQLLLLFGIDGNVKSNS